MKKLLKSVLVMSIALATTVGATGAYFTSQVTAANNQIIAGTLRLAIDSTQVHSNVGTWGFPQAYTVVQDVNGVNTQYNTLETWTNAAPAPYSPYVFVPGTQTFPDGNHSWWVSVRNAGSITMKAKLGLLQGGSWVVNPAVAAANPGVCTSANLNLVANSVTIQNVNIYRNTAGNICKSSEECQNIYFGLTTGPWVYSTDANASGADVAFVPPVSGQWAYVSTTGAVGGTPITLKQNEFIIVRMDGNFNVSDNCFQGATYTYNVTGNAYQVGDPGW